MAEGKAKQFCLSNEVQGEFSPIEFSPDEDDYKVVTNIPVCPEDHSDSESTAENSGYITFTEVYTASKIKEHRSYHNTISREEADRLLELAPEKGYITRFSENRKRYILSVFCPSSREVQHFILIVDEEAPSYVLNGTGKSFRCIEQLLDYYENNPVSAKYGEIGISYSRNNTRQWKLEHEQKMRRQQKEEQERVSHELKDKGEERTYSQAEMMEMQQRLLDQQTNTMRKNFIEPLTQQHREYQEQIVQLQKANQELLEYMNKKKNRRHKQCTVQ